MRPEEDAELRRLREDLYRPAPPPGAVERYTARLERQHLERPERAAERVEDVRPAVARPALRRALIAGAIAVVAALVISGVLLQRPARDPGAAEALVTGGPYAVADRDAFAALLTPSDVNVRSLARAVRGSEMQQLDVWDTRDPAVWVQDGRGPLSRRFDGRRLAAPETRPFSIAVRCSGSGRYRWTITGTTEARPAVHVLESAGAACGDGPTIATFTRPAGAVVRGFDVAVADDTRWGMAFVYAIGGS